ncbi:MAG: YbaB/EbfC family nucleoid-associated protein [Erysipelotrichaceae bacterium]|nr:YbaB/EbfC family nucleoid-associated protein [Erysipelotrichaceae bacterium]
MNQQAMMRLKKMQKQMMEAQEKLESSVFTGTAGGGVVTVEVKGTHEVLSVTIDEEAIKDDLEMVQDMIVIAINDANKKIDAETQKTMGAFGGGMGLF